MPARPARLSPRRRGRAAPAAGRPDPSAPAGDLAVRQLGRLMSRLGVPPEAHELFYGMASFIADAYADAWAEMAEDAPSGRERLDPRRLALLRARAQRVAEAMRTPLTDIERWALYAGVVWPLPVRGRPFEPVTAAGATLVFTLGEELLTVYSAGMSLPALLATIPVLQAIETYMTASARTNEYRRAEVGYDVEVIAADVHAALTGSSQGKSAEIAGTQLIADLVDVAVKRLSSRVWQVLAVGVGALWAAAGSGRRVRRVIRLPALRDTGASPPPRHPGPDRAQVVTVLAAGLAGRPAPTVAGLPAATLPA